MAGDSAVYGLARPPGHHCPRSAFGGYGLFNYSAAASAYLADRVGRVGRVAVLDVDYHHGNGTQQIFYHRADVLYVSLHADPDRAFPYFIGWADENGAGPGEGFTLNLPLPAGCTNDHHLARWRPRSSASPSTTPPRSSSRSASPEARSSAIRSSGAFPSFTIRPP